MNNNYDPEGYYPIIRWWQQYAIGITGINYYIDIFETDSLTLKQAKACVRDFKKHLKKQYKPPDRSTGYGAAGTAALVKSIIVKGNKVDETVACMKKDAGQTYPTVRVISESTKVLQ